MSQPERALWRSPEDRLGLVFEVLVVVLVGVLPYLAGALLGAAPSHPSGQPEREAMQEAVSRGVMILQIAAPVLFIMWRSGRPWRYFGISPFRFKDDVPLAVIYVIAAWVVFYAYWIVLGVVSMAVPALNRAMWSMNSTAESRQVAQTLDAMPLAPILVLMLANGFAEELVTKAYLIPRLRELTGRTWLAVLVSSGLFASYHLYHGAVAAGGIFVTQVLMGWLFVRIGRLWPIALGHALYDLVLVAMRA